MPRRRIYDPRGLPEQPNLVTDTVRVAEIVAEIARKLRYLAFSYQLEKRLSLDQVSLNASLRRLKAGVNVLAPEGAKLMELHPFLAITINMQARELAGIAAAAPLADEHGVHVRQAAQNVAARAKGVRGTPGHVQMRRYVEALMVIWQEATGKAVLSLRDRSGIYDPAIPGSAGEWICSFVHDLDPEIRISKLVYWVRESRKKYVEGWPSFGQLFPGYALRHETRPPCEALPTRWPGAQFSVLQPIYCPF